jgi:acetyl-CoA carboxylase carboxyl transferase subunit alpha
MLEHAIYSVIPPEGCAAILWRDANRKIEAAEALKLTAPDLLDRGIIDEIVAEPVGGAHTDADRSTALLDEALNRALSDLRGANSGTLGENRYQKFRNMGRLGIDFRDEGEGVPGG